MNGLLRMHWEKKQKEETDNKNEKLNEEDDKIKE